jgi:hypothetical protein
MTLSPGKCIALSAARAAHTYYIDAHPLPTRTVTRDLGVLVSTDLDFSCHVRELVKSCIRLINTIFRCFVIRSPDVYVKLYKSLVLPKIIYCGPVYRPSQVGLVSAIESIQKRFLRRLRWRCGDNVGVDLPPLMSILDSQDRRLLISLAKANLLDRFFTVGRNRLRSQFNVLPLSVARTQTTKHLFSWRILERLFNGDENLRLFIISLSPPFMQ